jgi:hypothetical protein
MFCYYIKYLFLLGMHGYFCSIAFSLSALVYLYVLHIYIFNQHRNLQSVITTLFVPKSSAVTASHYAVRRFSCTDYKASNLMGILFFNMMTSE